jgi:hypothetical protein
MTRYICIAQPNVPKLWPQLWKTAFGKLATSYRTEMEAVTLRLETSFTYYPERYVDKKGREIWEMVERFLAKLPKQRTFAAACTL